MSLSILSVAYPLAPVSPDTAGGAEQVLAALDEALEASGHRSVVVASEDSRVGGTLVPFGQEPGVLDEQAVARAQTRCRAAIATALSRFPVDLVHMHGIDFAATMPAAGPPVLVTLHLPLSWYGPHDGAAVPARRDVYFVPVSETQALSAPPGMRLLAPIENGVPVDSLAAQDDRERPRRFALFLGRLCPEKGVHLAIDAARAAGVPLLIGGALFPYPAHLDYFEREVKPRLGGAVRWLGPVGFAAKRRLLQRARCLLVPSLAAETSSLVAREAMAAGAPVIAFPAGALPEIVKDGETGFLVDTAEAMARAIPLADAIDRAGCQAFARERFALSRMTDCYLALYHSLVAEHRGAGAVTRAS